MIIGIIILSVLITFLIWLFIIFLLKQGAKQAKIQKEKRNKVKGKFGEQLVSMCINKFKDEDEILINNFLFHDKYDKQHEIDHIFFSKRGIFVIETKNYIGSIHKYDYEHYIQILPNGNNNPPFYSPVKQNEGHIRSLLYLLKDNGIYLTYDERESLFHSLIVFIKSDISSIEEPTVINLSDLEETIFSYPIECNQQLIHDIANTIVEIQNKQVSSE